MTRLIVKVLTFMLVCFAWCAEVAGQNKAVYSIGDKFPLQTLVDLLVKQGHKNISEKDFENKCLLFDFWNIWCHSCWKGMQKIDDLQKEFRNDLVIVKITSNNKLEIKATESKLNIAPSAVLSLTDDSIMFKRFPHIGDPLHVWVDKRGIIRYSAYGHNATSKNIAAFVKGQRLDLSTRGDMGIGDEPKSLLENAGGTLANAVLGYSVLVKGVHEYASLASFERKKISQLPPAIGFYQVTVLDLFRSAYFKDIYGFEQPRLFTGNNRIVLAVKDSVPFIKSVDSNKIDSWNNQYLLSYETANVGPSGSMKTLQQDLEKYFPYRVSIESRNVLCRILVWKNAAHRFFPQVKKDGETYEFSRDNISMQTFFNLLFFAAQKDSLPLLDEVGWNGPVSVHFQSKLEDVLEKRTELQSYGLDIVEEVRPIIVLVIMDSVQRP